MRMLDLIEKKKNGLAHTPEELAFIAQAASGGSAPDYQLSAWLMAVVWRGMTPSETAGLTRAMTASGRRLDLAALKGPKIDKHSTGGVGDGVSIPLAPLAAAAGLVVPMMSGRGLGHTGGTLDQLESIQGFKVSLPPDTIMKHLEDAGLCLFGQSADLAPADRKLYALRDVTSTVGSDPLIVGSILSKKLSEDLDGLVMDVKIGPGAIYPEPAKMKALARHLVSTSKLLGLPAVAVLTRMEEPLGYAVGNALEIRQAIEILRGGGPEDYLEVLRTLGGWMLKLGGKARTWQEGAETIETLRTNGAGLERFRHIVKLQGGDTGGFDDPDTHLPLAKHSAEVKAARAGFVTGLDARGVGKIAVRLGAGREKADDAIDFGAGLMLHKKRGDAVKKGEALATLYSSDPARLAEAVKAFPEQVTISPKRASVPKVIVGVVR